MRHHLAQVNVGLTVAPLTSPQLADFMAALEPVNAVADDAPGFVWRLQADDGNATSVRFSSDDQVIVNMSVWESLESLQHFAYHNPAHVAVLRQRRMWFQHLADAYQCLWWVPAGHLPTVEEAEERLTHLRAKGASPYAFTFKETFPPDTGA